MVSVARICCRLKSSRFGRNAFWSLIGAVFMRGLGLLTTVLLVRILGAKVFGQFIALQGALGLFGTLAGLGMGMTITKHLAELKPRNPKKAGRIVALCSLFSMSSAVVIALGMWAGAEFLCEHIFNSQELLVPFKIAMVLLLANTLNGLLDSAFQGLEKYKMLSSVMSFYGVGYLLLGASGAFFFGLLGAISALAGCRLLIAVVKVSFLIREKIPFEVKGMFGEWKVIRDYSLPAMGGSLVSGPVDWLPSLVFASVPGGYEALGIFGAYNQIRSFILFLPDAVGRTNIPILADIYANGDSRTFFRKLRRGVFINLGLSLLIAIPFVLSHRVLQELYALEYGRSFLVIMIISLVGVTIATDNALGYAYICSGQAWRDFRFRFVSLFSSLIILVLLRFYLEDIVLGISVFQLSFWIVYGGALIISFHSVFVKKKSNGVATSSQIYSDTGEEVL